MNDIPEIQPVSYAYHRRKADQAWDLAGCARQDGDKADEERWTKIAREHQRLATEFFHAGDKG